jgi:paraquat-inducible protein B
MAADRQTTIGAFVLGGLLLALGAIIFFGNFRLFHPTRRAAVVFEGSISGLSVGAPVNFRGVRVGAVDSISIQFDAKTRTAYIPVTVQLEPERVRVSNDAGAEIKVDLPILISRGLRAELNTQSFVTGQAEINLDFNPASPAVLHPNVTNLTEIPTQQSTIQRVRQQLTELPLRELVENAIQTLESVRGVSDKLNVNLPPLFASLKTTSDNATRVVDVATQTLERLQNDLASTLGRINKLADNADLRLNQRSAELQTLLLSTNQTVLQTRAVLNNLNSLTSDRGNARANLEASLRDLAATAASLRGFASDVERNPQLLLMGRRP